MFVLAVLLLSALALAVFLVFIAVVIGLRHAHPTDLALQRPTRSAALASRVVGLHVHRAEPGQRAELAAGHGQALR
jgi:hypothetical protein